MSSLLSIDCKRRFSLILLTKLYLNFVLLQAVLAWIYHTFGVSDLSLRYFLKIPETVVLDALYKIMWVAFCLFSIS